MAQCIIIIGGLPDDPTRSEVLAALHAQSVVDIEWEWIKADPPHYNVAPKLINRLVVTFRNSKTDAELPRVVKLALLNGRVQNTVHKAVSEPVLAPTTLHGCDDLIDWLFSPEANLIPRKEWLGNVSEAALAAVLSKLIKKKAWSAKKGGGHAWVVEDHLLGDHPVNRPELDLRNEAEALLDLGRGILFGLKKGGQGKTPRAWFIYLRYQGVVKRLILEQSFAVLNDHDELVPLLEKLQDGGEATHRIDSTIVTERVRQACTQLSA